LSPKEARDLLVILQASATHDLPPADIEHKTVAQDGLSVNLTIVGPIGVKEPPLFFQGAVSCWATFQRMTGSFAI
jgi:hypothetical protein